MNYLKLGGSLLKYLKGKSQLLIIALVVGFLFGIIYINIFVKRMGITIDIFQRFFWEKFEKTNVVSEQLFWYVVRTRFLSIAMIIVVGCSRWKRAGIFLWCGGTGFLFGTLIVLSIVQMGMQGLVLCIAALFPHMLFYVPAYIIVLAYFYEYPRKQWNWAKTIFVFLTIFMGFVLESYVNPAVMKIVLKLV